MLIRKGFNLVKVKNNTFLWDSTAKKEQDTEQRTAVLFLHCADLHQMSICPPAFFPIKYFPFIQVFKMFEGKMQGVEAKTLSGKLTVP